MFKRLLIAFSILLVCSLPAAAKDSKTFAVMPFSVHGPQEYQYLSQGIQSMLTTRLAWPDHFTPVEAAALKKSGAAKITDPVQAKSAIATTGADYVVWGASTIMGKECSVDINVTDVAGKTTPFSVQTPVDSLIPALESKSKEINTQIVGKPAGMAGSKASATPSAPTTSTQPMNPALIVNETQGGAYANPSLKYQDPDSTMGRWRSQTLPYSSHGMVVCDGDGDGKNEVFILSESKLLAFRVANGEMRPAGELELPKNLNYVRLNSIDLNHDGRHEFAIASAQGKDPRSLIVSYDGTKFTIEEDNLPFFVGVLNMPPSFSSTLVGQGVGQTRYLDSKIHYVTKSNGKYALGPAFELPLGGTVFNVTYLPIGNDYQLIMIDDNDHMHVFSSTGALLTVSDETYAGSSLGIEYTTAPLGLSTPSYNVIPPDKVFIPLRAIPCNLDKDNRFELLISRNISVAAQVFSNYRDYPQGEIHSLYWDGVGMSLQWKTAMIKGTITDYALADIDNNGKIDLIVNINTHTGVTGTSQKKTLIVSYPLDTALGVSTK